MESGERIRFHGRKNKSTIKVINDAYLIDININI